MALAFGLLLWAVIGIIAACVSAVIFGGATALLTQNVTGNRRKAIITASVFPFLCLGWAGIELFFEAVINEQFLNRDIGMGDAWYAPLPNGYRVMMIDVTDHGSISKMSAPDGHEEDTISGVRNLQVTDRYILGSADSHYAQHSYTEADRNQVDSYFLLDMRTGKRTQFQDYDSLRASTTALHIDLNLQPIFDIYAKYRFSWFEVFSGLLLCIPPVIGAAVIIRWIQRLRRSRVVFV